MRYNRTWKYMIRKVGYIVTLRLTEAFRVGLKLRLITAGRVFIAKRVTLIGNRLTLIYEEEYSPNWI